LTISTFTQATQTQPVKMSRGSNRNKIKNGVNSSKKIKARNEIDTLNLPILVGILVTIMCLLVVSIRSCSNLRGALTMMNPNMMPGQKGMGIPHMVPIKGPATMENNNNNVVQSVNVAYPPGYAPSNNKRNNINIVPKKRKPKPADVESFIQETLAERKVATQFDGTSTSTGMNTGHVLPREDASSSTEHFYYFFNSHTGTFHLKDEYTTYPNNPAKVSMPASRTLDTSFQSALSLSRKHLPSLCKHDHGYGFSDLNTLRNAIEELNTAYGNAVERYLQYQGALAEYTQIVSENSSDVIQSPPTLPQYMKEFLEVTPDPFVICPFTHLKSAIHGRHGPLHIDAEEVVIECDSCIIDAPATHISFGSLAKNAVIRGVTLMGATDTSAIFRENGAEVLFEDCIFIRNEGNGVQGAVADLNSTRLVFLFMITKARGEFYH
jgi:hypothetical protein